MLCSYISHWMHINLCHWGHEAVLCSVSEPVRLEYVVCICICMHALVPMPKALFLVDYAL